MLLPMPTKAPDSTWVVVTAPLLALPNQMPWTTVWLLTPAGGTVAVTQGPVPLDPLLPLLPLELELLELLELDPELLLPDELEDDELLLLDELELEEEEELEELEVPDEPEEPDDPELELPLPLVLVDEEEELLEVVLEGLQAKSVEAASAASQLKRVFMCPP
jgi:hypothetical protein